jgi:hypothetical protein
VKSRKKSNATQFNRTEVVDGRHRHLASCQAVSMSQEELTPEKAAFFLHYNIANNRPINKKIEEYKRDMLAGDWQDGHPAPIVFDVDGNLIDGQHRLLAVVQTGVTISVWVYRGAERKTQETIDTGKSRTLEHTLHMMGEKNVNTLTSILRGLHNYEANKKSIERRSPRGISNRHALQMLEDNGDYYRALTLWSKRYHQNIPSMRRVLTKKSLGLLRHGLLEVAPESEVDTYFQLLAGQDVPGHAQPLAALRRRLEEMAVKHGSGRGLRANENTVNAYCIKAWNAFVSGDTIGQLRWSSGGSRPEKFPEIASFED